MRPVCTLIHTHSLLVLTLSHTYSNRLILVESRIHRLARYYKRVKKLPPNW